MNSKMQYQKAHEKEIREQLEKEINLDGYFVLWLKEGTYIKGEKYELTYPWLMIDAWDYSVQVKIHINQIDFIL